MPAGISLGCSARYNGSIQTKTDAMRYALEATAKLEEGGTLKFNLSEAKKVYDFYCENVTLVDTEVVSYDELIGQIFEKVKEVASSRC